MRNLTVVFIVLLFILSAGGDAMALELKSSAFSNGAPLPARYAPDGGDASPPLAWTGAPAGTKSFALIVDDPDAPAGTWVHWVVWNIPATATGIAQGQAATAALADGTRQGQNDFRKTGWMGPTPPSGTHRYVFKLSALDALLELPASTTKSGLEAAIKGHVLGHAEITATYTRAR